MQFPTKINREDISRNRVFISKNREFNCEQVSVHFLHACLLAVRTRSVLADRFSGGGRDVASSRTLRRGFLAGPSGCVESKRGLRGTPDSPQGLRQLAS